MILNGYGTGRQNDSERFTESGDRMILKGCGTGRQNDPEWPRNRETENRRG